MRKFNILLMMLFCSFLFADESVVSADDDLLERLSREVVELKKRRIVVDSVEDSTKGAIKAKFLGSKIVYSFIEGKIFEVNASVDKVTDIVLEVGERLVSEVVAGDTVRWKVSSLVSGEGDSVVSHIVIKPLEVGIETNLILSTNRRTYHLLVKASDWYMPQVSWNYPQVEKKDYEIDKKVKEEKLEIEPKNLNFGYEVSGDSFVDGLKVFDDGNKTYLRFGNVQELPAVFVVGDGEAEIINYRVVNDYLVIDRLVDRLELRLGKLRGEVVREGVTSFWDRIW